MSVVNSHMDLHLLFTYWKALLSSSRAKPINGKRHMGVLAYPQKACSVPCCFTSRVATVVPKCSHAQLHR